jgi:quercetin dioxygenase-like cupin family protein
MANAHEDIKGRALEPAGLIDYATGSVVSKTLLKKKTGSLTLFSFDTGQGLSEHTSPFDATVLILNGQADLTIGGNPVRARAGEMVVMPAGVPHALHASEPFKMLLIMIRSPDEDT